MTQGAVRPCQSYALLGAVNEIIAMEIIFSILLLGVVLTFVGLALDASRRW